jgi:transcriptional repressor OPI1
VRWFLGRRPNHKPMSGSKSGSEGSHKRRKVNNSGEGRETEGNNPHEPYPAYSQEPDLPHRHRAPSQSSYAESLPAYDEQRSPSYEVSQQVMIRSETDKELSPGSSWQSRLVLSTSGLSVAMSEESLRSLKYCLSWLRWANEHIGKVIEALKAALDQYDQGSQSSTSSAVTAIDWTSDKRNGQQNGQLIVRTDAERSALNARIAELKADVLKTLKDVVDIVSKYAGGALPENARILVRKHLTSLPQRFRLASANSDRSTEGGDREVTEGASRVMVLAKEGLDMMSQVSGVLDGTIVSAEEWCERLGMKKAEEQGGNTFEPEKIPGAPPVPLNGNVYQAAPDTKMI